MGEMSLSRSKTNSALQQEEKSPPASSAPHPIQADKNTEIIGAKIHRSAEHLQKQTQSQAPGYRQIYIYKATLLFALIQLQFTQLPCVYISSKLNPELLGPDILRKEKNFINYVLESCTHGEPLKEPGLGWNLQHCVTPRNFWMYFMLGFVNSLFLKKGRFVKSQIFPLDILRDTKVAFRLLALSMNDTIYKRIQSLAGWKKVIHLQASTHLLFLWIINTLIY